jgi:hypothetical protein
MEEIMEGIAIHIAVITAKAAFNHLIPSRVQEKKNTRTIQQSETERPIAQVQSETETNIKPVQMEINRTIVLILTLLRDEYNIYTFHDVARKKRAWTLEDPTEAEWLSLYTQGSCRHSDEVKELVERYESGTTARTLVQAVVTNGETTLKLYRVHRAWEIIQDLVDAGFDMQQLNLTFRNCQGQGMGEGELMDAIADVAHGHDNANNALLCLAVELCHLYDETGEVREVVWCVAEVGFQVLFSKYGRFILDV